MKNQTIEKLNEWGCDTAGALLRLSGDRECYCSLIKSYACPNELELVRTACSAGNMQAVMSAAFSLKCTYGDLGFTPMYDAASDIVDALRDKRIQDVPGLVDRLSENEKQMRRILEQ